MECPQASNGLAMEDVAFGRIAEDQYTFILEAGTRNEERRRRGEPWKVRKGWLQ